MQPPRRSLHAHAHDASGVLPRRGRWIFQSSRKCCVEQLVIFCMSSRCLTFNELLAVLFIRNKDKSSKRRRTWALRLIYGYRRPICQSTQCTVLNGMRKAAQLLGISMVYTWHGACGVLVLNRKHHCQIVKLFFVGSWRERNYFATSDGCGAKNVLWAFTGCTMSRGQATLPERRIIYIMHPLLQPAFCLPKCRGFRHSY